MRPRRTASLWTSVIGLILLMLAVVPAALGAGTQGHGSAGSLQAHVTRGSEYLALGDSVPFGYQEPAVVPPPNYSKPASFIGYPELVATALHIRLSNAACPGETSASLINKSAPSNGCENAYRKLHPLHVHYTGSQLAYAVQFLRHHRAVRIVSLMIGANDLFLCQKSTPGSCTTPSEQHALFVKVARNVHIIVRALRNQGHYHGQLVIVHYYSINYALAFINNIIRGLNHAIDTGAKPFHPRFADGFGEYRVASRHSFGNPCTAGLLTQLGPAACGVHPTYAGHAVLAHGVLKALRLDSIF